MRLLALAAVLAVSACNFVGGGPDTGAQSVVINTNARPDSLFRVASAYLTANGFTTTQLADSTLVTTPQPVPERARTSSTQDQQWILQVKTEKAFLMGGSRLRVTGFIIPRAANTPADTTTVRQATPITNRNAVLFNEVQTVANAIARAAGKR